MKVSADRSLLEMLETWFSREKADYERFRKDVVNKTIFDAFDDHPQAAGAKLSMNFNVAISSKPSWCYRLEKLRLQSVALHPAPRFSAQSQTRR